MNRFGQWLRTPRTLIGLGGLGGLAVASGGLLWATQYLALRQTGPLLESELTRLLGRPVKVGPVEKLGFFYVALGPSSIPAIPEDATAIALQGIQLDVNPWLFLVGQPVEIRATLIQPQVTLRQGKDGQWTTFKLPKGDKPLQLPLAITAQVKVQEGQISALPQGFQRPLVSQITGTGSWQYTPDGDTQTLTYTGDIQTQGSELTVKGTTDLTQGTSQTTLQINRLDLPQLAQLLPAFPLTLTQGQGQGQITGTFPHQDLPQGVQTQGDFQVSQVQGRVGNLKTPLKADLDLSLSGQTVKVNPSSITFGPLQTQLQGAIALDQGYNLSLKTNAVASQELLKAFNVKSPVSVAGQLQGQMAIRGPLQSPQVQGVVNTVGPGRVDRIPLKQVTLPFSANKDRLTVTDLRLQPQSGGELRGKGQVQWQLGKLINPPKNQPWHWQTLPITAQLTGQVDPLGLAKPYGIQPAQVQLGNLQVSGQGSGTLGSPQAQIQWQTLTPQTVAGLALTAQGVAKVQGAIVTVSDTTLRTPTGELRLSGQGNLRQDQWQGDVTGTNFTLTPWGQMVCGGRTDAICHLFQGDQPLTLNQGTLTFTGQGRTFNPDQWQGQGQAQLQRGQERVALTGQLRRGQVDGSINANHIGLSPYLPANFPPIQVQRLQAQGQFPLAPLLQGELPLAQINGTGQVTATLDRQPIAVRTALTQGQWTAQGQSGALNLQPFLPALPVTPTLVQGTLQARATVGDVTTWQDLQRLGLERVTGQGQFTLALGQDPITLKTELHQGQLTAIARGQDLNLEPWGVSVGTSAAINQANVSVITPIKGLLSPQPDLHQLQAIAEVGLTVAGGTVTSVSRLDQLAWQSRLTVDQLNIGHIPQLQPWIDQWEPLQGQAVLSGRLDPKLSPRQWLTALPLNLDQARFTSGQQQLTAKGSVVLGNLAQGPYLSRVNLAINSTVDLAQFPGEALLDRLPLAPEFRPTSLNTTGQAQFTGRLTGQAIRDWRDLTLAGGLNLRQLTVNGLAFAPQLAGLLTLQPRKTLNLDLKGNQDRIAFHLQPCAGNCPLPYLPQSFTVHLAEGRSQPITGEGKRQGDRLQMALHHFPLGALNLEPGQRYNLPGSIQGDLNAEGQWDLRRGQGQGELALQQLQWGPLPASQLTAALNYQNQQLDLRQGQLTLGKSQYQAKGSFNFQTQAIQGQVSVDQGEINPLLRALRISDLESVVRLATGQIPCPPTPVTSQCGSAIAPVTAGKPGQPLENQLNLLWLIDQQIIALAERYEQGGVPNELNILGTFDAQLTLGGTLQRPDLTMGLTGEHWSWYPQRPFPNIVPPVGLVLNETRFLPIRQVQLQARLQDGEITLLPSVIQIREAQLQAQGIWTAQGSQAQWGVTDFDLDILESFVALPGDVGGRINAQGTFQGTRAAPVFQGNFILDDLTLNARAVPEAIAGQIGYANHQFQLATLPSSPLTLQAQVPFFLDNQRAQQAGPQTFTVALTIPPDSLELLDVVTQDQLVWLGGEGSTALTIAGEVRQYDGWKLENLRALGKVVLANAQIKSPALPHPVVMNGEILFNNTAIAIEQLTGQLEDSQFAVSGILPLFNPAQAGDTPLQIQMNPTHISLPNLYGGNVGGVITVTGSAFQPIVGGEVTLSQGQIFVPDRPQASESDRLAELRSRLGWFRPRLARPLITPQLQDLRIGLADLSVEQNPLYQFVFSGDLTVNGPLLNLEQLRADGTINLQRGRVSFFDTRFLLDRRSPNTLTFSPDQDILNPDLNVAMRTIVSDLPQSARMRGENVNEYPDDSLNQIQRVDIRLLIDGDLNQLLPNLNPRYAAVCDPTITFRPLPGVGSFDDFQLDRLSRCLEILAARGLDTEQIFSNPAIELTSSPPRSEGEIVRLLGQQFIALVDALQGKNSSQLLQVGITQLAIPMIFQGAVYDVETAISDQIRSTDFRIVPFLEAIYQVEKQGFMRFTYDYSFNEFRVRYEKQF